MTKIAKLEPAPVPPVNMSDAHVVIAMIDKLIAAPDVPVERIEQLFALHQRVQSEHAKRAYYAAFAKLQADLPAVDRKGKAHNDKAYARFEDIMEAIRAPLAKHGFSVSFRTAQPDNKLAVTGVLAHELGHTEETTLVLPLDASGSKNAVQAYGSSVSYGKRYCLLTLLGIATQDDDDGKAAGSGETISEAQYEHIAGLIRDTGTKLEQVLAYHKIESLSDMTLPQFKQAVAMLQKKKEVRK